MVWFLAAKQSLMQNSFLLYTYIYIYIYIHSYVSVVSGEAKDKR